MVFIITGSSKIKRYFLDFTEPVIIDIDLIQLSAKGLDLTKVSDCDIR